ncbi:MAG: hypothetical protein U1E55_12980 [Paracoccus sp. (in: a-proteobacteria)]
MTGNKAGKRADRAAKAKDAPEEQPTGDRAAARAARKEANRLEREERRATRQAERAARKAGRADDAAAPVPAAPTDAAKAARATPAFVPASDPSVNKAPAPAAAEGSGDPAGTTAATGPADDAAKKAAKEPVKKPGGKGKVPAAGVAATAKTAPRQSAAAKAPKTAPEAKAETPPAPASNAKAGKDKASTAKATAARTGKDKSGTAKAGDAQPSAAKSGNDKAGKGETEKAKTSPAKPVAATPAVARAEPAAPPPPAGPAGKDGAPARKPAGKAAGKTTGKTTAKAAAKPAPGSARKAAAKPAPEFDILIVGQNGRLGVEAVLFAASLRRNAPDWRGRLIVAEPRPEAAWEGADIAMPAPVRDALAAFGAEILPFTATRFGRAYPYGNKIEALALLTPGRPFIFFDSDTLITGELAGLAVDFSRPSASMRRTATWPEPPPYGPGYGAIWKSLYDRFGLDFASSLDMAQPDEHWERYLYFNAGWFLGTDGPEFGRRFAEYASAIRDEPGDALACQSLDPWLDQVALPLVVHGFGGGRPGPELAGLDGDVSCHYRNLPLLYAREAEPVLDLIEDLAADPVIAPLLAGDEAVQRLIVAGEGRRVLRPLFADEDPPPTEQAIRHRLRREGLWLG